MEKTYIKLNNGRYEIMLSNMRHYREGTYTVISKEEYLAGRKLHNDIATLKSNLAKTDYKAIKYAEGLISDDEYLPIKTQREEWRKAIRELEREL